MSDRIEVICGFPPCPMCDKQLSLRNMPDEGETYWHCTRCGTQWRTPDLIEALNQVLELAIAMGTYDEFEDYE